MQAPLLQVKRETIDILPKLGLKVYKIKNRILTKSRYYLY